MINEFSLSELAKRLTSNRDERFTDTRLIRKTLCTRLPDIPGEVAYNSLAESYDWSLEPENGPQRISIAYEPDADIDDLGLLYLGALGKSFAHVIRPSQTRYENDAVLLRHLRQGQQMDLRVTYSED